MWCPAATAFYGTGSSTSTTEIPATSKLGGLYIAQCSNTYLNTGFLNKNTFNLLGYAKSMVETYGSDFTGFSEGGFVWASELEINLLAPRANFIGAYYRGTLSYGQLYEASAGMNISL